MQRYPLKIILHFSGLQLKEWLIPGKFISEKNILDDPFAQFEKWYKQAAKLIALNEAMCLSTVSKAARPSSRMVLLKSYKENGFIFYGNSGSRKGEELEENQFAALNFHWSRIGKQVRIEGKTIKVSKEEADSYFASRPRKSKLGAIASEQSKVINSREELINEVNRLDKQFQDSEIPRPELWIGWKLIPDRFEFWQNRANRLHDRFVYIKENDNKWSIKRLAP